MSLTHCKLLILAASIVCSRELATPARLSGAEGDVVAIHLRDGRVLTGVVNEKTDDAELWLHSAEPSILILTSTSWREISSASVAGKPVTPEAFRKEAEQSKTPLPIATFRQPAALARSAIPAPGRVQSLDVFASNANWDRDAESDGLALRLNPLAADGSTTAVDGMLTVRLLGRRRGTRDLRTSPPRFGFWTNGTPTTEYSPLRADERYVELGRWTERVKASHFTRDGYVARLPFRNVHPEYDLDVGLDGLVQCRLSVNGQGILDAASSVSLRDYSPLRDQLQIDRGTRFFPDEARGSW